MVALIQSQRGYICAQTGHTKHIVLPVEKNDELRQVLCRCTTCGRDFVETLPLEEYAHFLRDLKDGKIVAQK